MPAPVAPAFDPNGYLSRAERDWELERVVAFDGLQPTQIVRFFQMPDGVETAEATRLPFRLDAAANADDRTNDAELVPTDLRRYVANPQVRKHQFAGLWTGGPVRWELDQATQRHRARQTLTRTFCAGHGYALDAEGRVSSMAGQLEFATVEAALKAHRPALKRIFVSRMAFDETIPGAYRTEITWRDFAHESIPFLEGAGGREAALAAARMHFGENCVKALSAVHCDIDPETNTVVAVASAVYGDTFESLAAAPLVASPCERRRLREFGWAEGGGEGWMLTHQFRYVNLRDTPAMRQALEFRADAQILADAAAHLGAGPWTVLSQKVEKDETEERGGMLSYVVVVGRPEWRGGAPELPAGVENAGGWGRVERLVRPSVPAADAGAAAASAASSAPAGRVALSVRRVERGDGSEDVERTLGVALDALPDSAPSLDGFAGLSVRRSSDGRRVEWTASAERLSAAGAQSVRAAARAAAEALPGARLSVEETALSPDGTRTVEVRAERVEPRAFDAFLRTADFYAEETRRIRWGVPARELTGGALRPDGTIVTSERTANADGATWDETVVVSAPTGEKHVYWSTLERRAHETRVVRHDLFRNVAAVPADLRGDAPVADGSVRQNERGLFDGEAIYAEPWRDEDDERRERSETHFESRTAERGLVESSRLGEARGGDGGALVSVSETVHPDGKRTSSVETRAPKPCRDLTWESVEGDGHHRRLVRHRALRNAAAVPAPAGGDSVRSVVSARHNEFGLVDAEISEWDASQGDDRGQGRGGNHFHTAASDMRVSKESRMGEAQRGEGGKIVEVDETVHPDGFIRSTRTEREAVRRVMRVFHTVEGDKFHRRVVEHGRVVNGEWEDLPGEMLNPPESPDDPRRVSGGARENEFGKIDAEWASFQADAGDNPHEKSVTRFETRERTVAAEEGSRLSEARLEEGVRRIDVSETDIGRGSFRVVRTVTEPREALHSVTWTETRRVNGEEIAKERASYWWRNSRRSNPFSIRGEPGVLVSMSEQPNDCGLYDGSAVVSPDWTYWTRRGGVSIGTDKKRTIKRKIVEERMVKGSDGRIQTQTRERNVTVKITVFRKSPSAAEVADLIEDGMKFRVYSILGHAVLERTISDTVVGDWRPSVPDVVWVGAATVREEKV